MLTILNIYNSSSFPTLSIHLKHFILPYLNAHLFNTHQPLPFTSSSADLWTQNHQPYNPCILSSYHLQCILSHNTPVQPFPIHSCMTTSHTHKTACPHIHTNQSNHFHFFHTQTQYNKSYSKSNADVTMQLIYFCLSTAIKVVTVTILLTSASMQQVTYTVNSS